jgi:hypothetical protein
MREFTLRLKGSGSKVLRLIGATSLHHRQIAEDVAERLADPAPAIGHA